MTTNQRNCRVTILNQDKIFHNNKKAMQSDIQIESERKTKKKTCRTMLFAFIFAPCSNKSITILSSLFIAANIKERKPFWKQHGRVRWMDEWTSQITEVSIWYWNVHIFCLDVGSKTQQKRHQRCLSMSTCGKKWGFVVLSLFQSMRILFQYFFHHRHIGPWGVKVNTAHLISSHSMQTSNRSMSCLWNCSFNSRVLLLVDDFML